MGPAVAGEPVFLAEVDPAFDDEPEREFARRERDRGAEWRVLQPLFRFDGDRHAGGQRDFAGPVDVSITLAAQSQTGANLFAGATGEVGEMAERRVVLAVRPGDAQPYRGRLPRG